MQFFDCSAMIGPHFAPRMVGPEGKRDGFPTADDLLAEMSFFGIDSALVFHGAAAEHSAMLGNRALCETVTGSRRLRPCWVVSPHHTGECLPPQELLAAMKESRVRAVRLLFGGPFGYAEGVDLVSHGDLLSALERARVPTFIEFALGGELSSGQVAQLDPLLERFPGLPVAVGAVKIATVAFRALVARVERYPRLHVDTSGLHETGALERLRDAGGVECLLYGTRFPWFGGGQARIALAQSSLSTEEQAAVAAGNLESLLEGARI